MKLIQVSAKFFSGTGVVVTGLSVAVEAFQLASNSWVELAQAVTDADGQLSSKIRFTSAAPFAPNLRLRKKDSTPAAILAQNPYLSYEASGALLLCDFGMIEQLDDTAYRNQETQTAFTADKTLISGQAKRPNISSATIIRHLRTSPINSGIEARTMKPVTFPLTRGTQSPEVANLQDALTVILEQAEIRPNNPDERSKLLAALAQDHQSQMYDRCTADVISIFQEERHLEISGNVDKATADGINRLLTPVESRSVLDSFDTELIKFRSIEAQLQQTISEKERVILDKDNLLVNTKKQVAALQQEVERISISESLLKQQNVIFTDEASRLNPVQDIAMNIGTQIDAANQKLRKEATPYQIHNIQLELRGTFSNDGKAMALSKLADSKEGLQNTSLVKLDLIANEQVSTGVTVVVPDVIGFTETIVRRLLKSVGLQTQSMNKSVSNSSEFIHGQAISQSPPAGSKMSHNQTVLVVFATV